MMEQGIAPSSGCLTLISLIAKLQAFRIDKAEPGNAESFLRQVSKL
jgi:hypothetical protein